MAASVHNPRHSRTVILVAWLTACSGPEPAQPVWPPLAGAYCGFAQDVCGADGTPWRCGDRPVWSRLDCAAECAALGGSNEGCRMLDTSERGTLAREAFATEEAAFSDAPGVACLCAPAERTACPGMHNRLCADREDLWVCNRTLQWQKLACETQCNALRPSLVALECQHLDHIWQGACACTAVGAPCPGDGERVCGHNDTWLLCQQGRWTVEVICDDAVDCNGVVPICDFAAEEPAACRCPGK